MAERAGEWQEQEPKVQRPDPAQVIYGFVRVCWPFALTVWKETVED
jgi:hypothetical protein